MRRRRPVNVWPAFADLMTVLAVVGLFFALGLLPYLGDNEDLVARLRKQKQRIAELEAILETHMTEQRERREAWQEERAELETQLREAANNEEMFQAIQRAQDIVDEISGGKELEFSRDQTLQFGDDLVAFDLNSVEPKWNPQGREKLRSFCRLLRRQLSRKRADGTPLNELFTVQVEGHTDATACPDDPNCNWWISSGRAASFVAVMRQERYCPGGKELELRPIGFADTKPYQQGPGLPARPTRRIGVRVIPNYPRIISEP